MDGRCYCSQLLDGQKSYAGLECNCHDSNKTDKAAELKMRTFDSGATRDDDDEKSDYEGFFSPYAFMRFGRYMNDHRKQADGNIRDSDNWQKGISLAVYMKSAWRHFVEWWSLHRGVGKHEFDVDLEFDEAVSESLCAIIFNAMGYLHEVEKSRAMRTNTKPPMLCGPEVKE